MPTGLSGAASSTGFAVSSNGKIIPNMIELDFCNRTDAANAPRRIQIVGIGGAGANALDRLALDGVATASLIAVNTDAQALVASVAGEKIQLGASATRGLGSGGDPELGRCAAEESAAEIRAALEGSEAVFLLAGLGGGTGSGAAPIVAELAREAGALVIAVVTLPFSFEGKRRAAQAADALAELQRQADAVICFENDRMGESVPPRAGIQTAFAAADQTLSQSVRALTALLNRSGLLHLGMDDLATLLQEVNARCLFGYGEAEGSNRAFDALSRAFKNPLMEKGRLLRDCETVIVQVTGGSDMTLDEVQLLMEEFNRYINDHTRILFGTGVDEALTGRITVMVMGSVHEAQAGASARPAAPARAERPERAPAPAPRAAAPQPEPELLPQEPEEPQEALEPEPEVALEAEAPEEMFEEEPVEPEAAEMAEIPEGDEPFQLQPTGESEPGLPVVNHEDVAEPEPESAPAEPAPKWPGKPRGLRAATTQASLFGEEPAAPVEKIAPPVPGRMLRNPFFRRPAPAEPAPEPVPEPQVAAPARMHAPEPEPEPEPIAPPQPAPAPAAAATPAPQARPPLRRIERRPAPAAPRPQELIPANELPPQAAPGGKTPQQEVMQFEPVTRGRFEKSEPTIVDGQDLDVPTYLRRRVKVR